MRYRNKREEKAKNNGILRDMDKLSVYDKPSDTSLLFSEIRSLYLNSKYKKVISLANDFLKTNYNDTGVRNMLAKSYRYLGMYNEAKLELKKNLEINILDEESLKDLFFLFYFLGEYRNVEKMLPIIEKRGCIHPDSIDIIKLVVNKSLGKEYNTEGTGYVTKQIINYDYDLAVDHIEYRHANELDEKSYFDSKLNVRNLIDCIRQDIKKENRANIEEILDVYYYCIPNIGYDGGELCSYVKVLVIPSTSDIINMYPAKTIKGNKYQILNCDYDLLFYKDKVKSMSQIEKFNKRFNRV